MKYNIETNVLTKEQRKKLLDKVYNIALSNNTPKGITKEMLYNATTGLGGLHDLSLKEFSSYYEYSKAKKEFEMGQFFTPDYVCSDIVDILGISKKDVVADITSGKGSFINVCPNESNFYSNELDERFYAIAKFLFPDAHHTNLDFVDYYTDLEFDFVVGNPPFNIKTKNNNVSQLEYINKSYNLLTRGGFLSLIVPKSYLEDEFFYKSHINTINKNFSFIGSYLLKNDTFDANISTKVMFFQSKWDEESDYNGFNNSYITKQEIEEKIVELKKNKNMILLGKRKSSNNFRVKVSHKYKSDVAIEMNLSKHESFDIKENVLDYSDSVLGFDFIVKKLLFEMKYQPRWEKAYLKSLAYLKKFESQVAPKGLSEEQYDYWRKNVRVTEKKVISYMKQRMKETTKKRKTQELSDRKQKKLNNFLIMQTRSFKDMKEDGGIEEYLNNINYNGKILTDVQKRDINLLLQKQSAYLQWGMGSGKTLAGITVADKRMIDKQAKYTFIVAPAIAIKNTWEDFMIDLGKDYNMIKAKTINGNRNFFDFDNINVGSYNLFTFHSLGENIRGLKKFIKKVGSKNVMLILDEADSIMNPKSSRSKYVHSAFSRVRYKLLLSGTMTRNNIAEAFSQLSLLLSNRLVNTCYVLRKYNRQGDLEITDNKVNYNKPFYRYTRGLAEFKSCFNPDKPTVLGIGKQTQNIYNSDKLKDILDCSVITRTLKDVLGVDLYKNTQMTISQSEQEKDLNKIVISEFDMIRSKYFESTGNTRKDAAFRALQHLNSMLRACVVPEHFNEYKGSKSTKKREVLNLINNYEGFVAIGFTHINSAKSYYEYIKNNVEGRSVFIITGKENSLSERKKIINEMKNYPGSILVSTQQSLSSSMNIDFVDKIIIPELAWNLASVFQYAFRFIRFTSKNEKEIIFVTYENSIESNLLKLIMNKEVLNRFMKDDDLDEQELYEEFNINNNIFSTLLTKMRDEDGKVFVDWDSQEIA